MDTVLKTEVDLANALNNLTYSRIISPIEGKAGYVFPTIGEFIRQNEDTIVTINQISPIHVDFYLPQRYIHPIQDAMKERTLKVLAIIRNEIMVEKGELTFFDNTVDPDTGTIWLKGTFPNLDERLWPGDFVQARLRLRVDRYALVIPFAATCFGPDGTYVWALLKNGTKTESSNATGQPEHQAGNS